VAERACAIDPGDRSVQSNAVWQVNQLSEVLLRMGEVDKLLALIEVFVQRQPENGQRHLAAANILAIVLRSAAQADPVGLDQTDPAKPGSAGADNTDQIPVLSTDEREQVLSAGQEYLHRAIQSGALSEDDIAIGPLQILRL
jgi:hypothetical protein